MPLDLLIPDLLAAPQSFLDGLRMPALERLLARGDKARRAECTATQLLATAFALPAPMPVAAITLSADDEPRMGTWLRADPVHLRVEGDGLIVHDVAAFGIDAHESHALVAALQSFFAGDGLEFRAPVPERWYVRIPEDEAPRTVPLENALGRNMFGFLPRGGARINWPSSLTEAQMLFSAHEVNATREAEGRPAINSVWFWGAGKLPATIASPYALVCANDPVARGLAILSRTRLADVPAAIDAVDAVRQGETVLVLLDSLTAPLRRGDESAWKQAAQSIDEDWLVGLPGIIDRFESVRLVLPARRDTLVAALTPSSRWRWLRRKSALASHA